MSDVVADDDLTTAQRAERGSYVGCVAGALSFSEYTRELRDAGFAEISITPTNEIASGMHSAIIKAVKASQPTRPLTRKEEIPLVSKNACC